MNALPCPKCKDNSFQLIIKQKYILQILKFLQKIYGQKQEKYFKEKWVLMKYLL